MDGMITRVAAHRESRPAPRTVVALIAALTLAFALAVVVPAEAGWAAPVVAAKPDKPGGGNGWAVPHATEPSIRTRAQSDRINMQRVNLT